MVLLHLSNLFELCEAAAVWTDRQFKLLLRFWWWCTAFERHSKQRNPTYMDDKSDVFNFSTVGKYQFLRTCIRYLLFTMPLMFLVTSVRSTNSILWLNRLQVNADIGFKRVHTASLAATAYTVGSLRTTGKSVYQLGRRQLYALLQSTAGERIYPCVCRTL